MFLRHLCAAVLLLSATALCATGNYVVPTTTLAAQMANNTSTANSFATQSNGNSGAGNISKVDVHSLLYSGENTKIYAHLMLWFGQTNHMNVGYSSTDAAQVHRQITDMISRGIDGVIIDWYGPNNSIDQATQLVMAEAENHPGFTFAIMVDQGAIEWDSCPGCTPQQALISQLQYIEQTYFPSKAYLTVHGRPVVTNFNLDLSYTIDWNAVNSALSTQPLFVFQNNTGFSHVLSGGSYSWVMPTTTDYGMSYLKSFYNTGIPLSNEQTVGATYKGFNDSLAGWGSGRIMGQQCGQTWLRTFSEINSLYNSGKQLPMLQLVTWNDYEEATEIESGISNCLTVSASVSGKSLQWAIKGNESTVDHYVAYISTDSKNLMALGNANIGTRSMNLCSYPIPNGNYVLYLQAVGKPAITNQISGPVTFTSTCGKTTEGAPVTLGTNPSSVSITSGGSGKITVTATPQSGAFDTAITLSCSGLSQSLTCSFAPSSITPGSSIAKSVLTISDNSTVSRNDTGGRRNPFAAVWLFGLSAIGLSLLGKVEGKRLVAAVGSCILFGLLIASASCGGGTGSVNSPGGNTHAITINGTSGPVQVSASVAVTVTVQ